MSAFMKVWPPLFQKLTLDDSRKVRELTQTVNEEICKGLGRNFAPYLKSIVPYWFLSQFDLHSPVGSGATKSFQLVFPSAEKQKGAISYAINEILDLVRRNLQSALVGCKKGPEESTESHVGKKGLNCFVKNVFVNFCSARRIGLLSIMFLYG